MAVGASVEKEIRMVLFKREPALWIGLVGACLNLAAGFGLSITTEQVALVNTAVAAVLALVAAVAVRPFPVPLLMGAVTSALSAAAGFGLDISSEQIGLVNAGIVALTAFVLRGHVSPASGPVTSPATGASVGRGPGGF